MQTHLLSYLVLTTVLIFSKSAFSHELPTPPTPPPSPSLLAHPKLASDPPTPPPSPSPSPLAPLCMAELSPCLPFLRGEGSTPSKSCCTGVVDMSNKAKSKGNREAICGCVKKALANVQYQPKLISVLPENCGASMTLPPIDSKTDCSKP
ncbi:hypothetical protein BT93_E0029 [Corymbia citriodora subsp. variegata]|nr:hypothetical protein BT93_E0029 [Corymbia citriodora subsp. variegata]